MICYFRAVQVARAEVEVLETRVQLAGLLAKEERYAEATAQVRAALQCREKNGYRIPQGLAQLAASDWYHRYGALPNVTKEPDAAQAANALIFGADASDLVYRLGVIDNQNAEKALTHVVFGPDDGAILRYRGMEGVSKLAVGTFVEVGFVKGEKRPVTYRSSEKRLIPGVCEQFDGELIQRPGQAFAFVIADGGQGVYVHPRLAGALRELVGHKVSCRAVSGKDKQGKPGWRALWIERSVPGCTSGAETRKVGEV